MARESILITDKEMVSTFMTAIRLGMSNVKAADFAGFNDKTIYLWISKGEKDIERGKKSIYVEFINSLKKARADFQVMNLKRIMDASNNGTWQASAWLLERRCPDEFGQRRDSTDDTERITVVNDVPKRRD